MSKGGSVVTSRQLALLNLSVWRSVVVPLVLGSLMLKLSLQIHSELTSRPVSCTYALVCNRPRELKGVQGVVLTSPGMRNTEMIWTGLDQTMQVRRLNNHLPIQEKPSLRQATQTPSQVTHCYNK